MSNINNKKPEERVLLPHIVRTIVAAKKQSILAKQVIQLALAAIMEQYELVGDMEVTFKEASASAPAGNDPTSKAALADSTFTVRRPQKSAPEAPITKPLGTRPHTNRPPPSKAPAKPSDKAAAKAATNEAPGASNTTVTLYKAPAYVAPTSKSPKYDLGGFKIRKYKPYIDKPGDDKPDDEGSRDDKPRVEKARTEDTAAVPDVRRHFLGNPRKRKADSDESDRPRRRSASGCLFILS